MAESVGGGLAVKIEAIRLRLVEGVALAVTEALADLAALDADESEIGRVLALRPPRQ